MDKNKFHKLTQDEVLQLRNNEIKERNENIQEINENISDLSEIFNDINELVDAQQIKFDIIENNINESQNNVTSGLESLNKAHDHAKLNGLFAPIIVTTVGGLIIGGPIGAVACTGTSMGILGGTALGLTTGVVGGSSLGAAIGIITKKIFK